MTKPGSGSDEGNRALPEEGSSEALRELYAVTDVVATTLFGSSRRTPRAAAALLRARAAAAGAPLQEVDNVDLVAAVTGAECWMLALNTVSLGTPFRYGSPAVSALAAVLARASGNAEVQICPPVAGAEGAADKIRHVELLARWAVNMLGDDATEALSRAAADLSAGMTDPRFENMAGLLMIVSENPTPEK